MGIMDKLTGKPRDDQWAEGGHVSGNQHTGPTGVPATGAGYNDGAHSSMPGGHHAQPGVGHSNVATGASYGHDQPGYADQRGYAHDQQPGYNAPPQSGHSLPPGAAAHDTHGTHSSHSGGGGVGGILHRDKHHDERTAQTGYADGRHDPSLQSSHHSPPTATTGHHGVGGHHSSTTGGGSMTKLEQARIAEREAEEARRRSHTLGQEAKVEAERAEREAKEQLRLAEQRVKDAHAHHKEAKRF